MKDVVKSRRRQNAGRTAAQEINEVVARLIDEHGYNSTSANDLLNM
ncbi:hypothetical protein PO124_30840 [Bacillus licheniformis]|nr:hypothetical protein [Bacillus licheniformis]